MPCPVRLFDQLGMAHMVKLLKHWTRKKETDESPLSECAICFLNQLMPRGRIGKCIYSGEFVSDNLQKLVTHVKYAGTLIMITS